MKIKKIMLSLIVLVSGFFTFSCSDENESIIPQPTNMEEVAATGGVDGQDADLK